MYQAEVSATSADAKVISTNYIEHPLFSFDDALCCAFHYVFIKYVPDVSYSKGYALRSAIKDFLDFRQDHNNKLHPELHLKNIEGVGVEQFRLFMDRLLRNGRTLYAAVSIKSAVVKVARNNDDGLPVLTLPKVSIKTTVREPLDKAADADFYKSLRSEMDGLRIMLEFRKQIASAEPYRVDEIRLMLRELLAVNKISEWVIDPARAMRTLLDDGYPFKVTRSDFAELRIKLSRLPYVKSMTRPSDFVLGCCLPYRYSILRGRTLNSIAYDELVRMYYPCAKSQSTVALFIQRQSAWNKEAVIAIDKDNFLHPMSEVAHSDLVVVVSEKKKSQSGTRNYEYPKLAKAISSKSDKYSVYNLICLAKELSEPLTEILDDSGRCTVDNPLKHTVFLCISEHESNWAFNEAGPDIRINSLNDQEYWNIGVAGFLSKYQLVDAGALLCSAIDLEGRLRVTWEYYDVKETKHPLSLTALKLGHSSLETTSAHYDSSPMAIKDRKVRYRSIQEELMERFRSNKFHGVVGSTLRAKSADPTFRIFTIMGHERALWACIDSSKPDYPEAVELSKNERCTRLDKCLFCSRIYVLGDSLPFLLERLSTLQRAVEADEGRLEVHKDEIEILEYLLSIWGNKSAFTEALIYMRKYEALLPFDMRSLIAYIED
jgi:hypothetical protein